MPFQALHFALVRPARRHTAVPPCLPCHAPREASTPFSRWAATSAALPSPSPSTTEQPPQSSHPRPVLYLVFCRSGVRRRQGSGGAAAVRLAGAAQERGGVQLDAPCLPLSAELQRLLESVCDAVFRAMLPEEGIRELLNDPLGFEGPWKWRLDPHKLLLYSRPHATMVLVSYSPLTRYPHPPARRFHSILHENTRPYALQAYDFPTELREQSV